MCEMRISSLLGKITIVVFICSFGLSARAKYGGGTGEPNDPYQIADANDLLELGTTTDDYDKHFILIADVNMVGYTFTTAVIAADTDNTNDDFDGIPFTGVFDGAGHRILNLTIDSAGDNYFLGLIGFIHGEKAQVKNLGLGSVSITITGGNSSRCLGGLCGRNNGTISNCYITGSLTGVYGVGGLVGYNTFGTISNCYSKASVSGDRLIGGLVGINGSTITNCCSSGTVSGTSWQVGGLVGDNRGTITNSYSTNNVSGIRYVGGLVGDNSGGTINNCYAERGSVSSSDLVGGLCGNNWGGTITNCYSTASVSGNYKVGGLVGCNPHGEVTVSFWDIETSGQTTSAGGTGKTTAEMQTISTFTNAGWDFVNIWWILEGAGYPRLCWEDKYGGGSGRPNDPYLIYTAEQMNTIGACQCDWDKCFKLMADIDLSGYTGTSFNIIGEYIGWDDPNNRPFTGIFDGNGHTISNFSYSSRGTSNLGLFGYVDGPNAEIKNLGLIDPNIDAGTMDYVGSLVGSIDDGAISNCYTKGGSVSGDDYVGGLVGYNGYVTISNSYVTSSVSGGYNSNFLGGLVGANLGTITNCYSTGSVAGIGNVGGLVGGIHKGTITNCYSTGSVSVTGWNVGGLVGWNYSGTITDCYSTGSVAGNWNVGGLMGRNYYSTITNCYSTGSVSGDERVGGLVGGNGDGTITNCCATGGAQGNEYVGGLVGYNDYGTITGCYSIGGIYGNLWIGGLVGYNHMGTISDCYSTAHVSGVFNDDYDEWEECFVAGGLVGKNTGMISNCRATITVWTGGEMVGGLVGENDKGTISNCYSTGNIRCYELAAGGLVGLNYYGTISECYSTTYIEGDYDVGGLVGGSLEEWVTNSFWDIETSGQTTSDGGTGLPTDQMQMQITFTDAGWDFVGETFNGIEDIWFIPQQDYPHLWWEGMQVPMKLTPRTLNCRSKGNWVKAHLILPEGFSVADVDSNRPAVLHSFGFESAPLYVFVNNEDGLVEIEATFERQAVCSLADNWPQELIVAGFLADGNIFLGTSTVRIIHPGMKVIEDLAWYWLNADCVHPDFCDGIDMNGDSLVNLLDYALLMNINVEFVTDE